MSRIAIQFGTKGKPILVRILRPYDPAWGYMGVVVCKYAHGKLDGAVCHFDDKQVRRLDRMGQGWRMTKADWDVIRFSLRKLGWKDENTPPTFSEPPLPEELWGASLLF